MQCTNSPESFAPLGIYIHTFIHNADSFTRADIYIYQSRPTTHVHSTCAMHSVHIFTYTCSKQLGVRQ